MPLNTVLVVDPNPATHRRVEAAFGGSSRTLYARGAVEARERSVGEHLDLVISAVRLANGNGYELARALRDDHPAALVFLLAGGFDVYDEERATAAGVDGRINVPFTAASLRSHIEASLGPLPDVLTSTDTDWGEDALPLAPPLSDAVASLAVPSVAIPPVSDERLASFLPRDYRAAEPVMVDPAVIGPALEKAIMEVLPEVVEGVLRSALTTSPAFRDLVDQAVARAAAERLAVKASDE